VVGKMLCSCNVSGLNVTQTCAGNLKFCDILRNMFETEILKDIIQTKLVLYEGGLCFVAC
jgi:hypothetical protein